MEKSNIKRRMLIICAALVVLLGVFSFIIYSTGNDERKFTAQLELGQKYLSELNYEQAVAAFREALDISPDNFEAIEGLVDAYLGWADKLISEENYDRALEVLTEGISYTNDQRLIDKKAEVEKLIEISKFDYETFSKQFTSLFEDLNNMSFVYAVKSSGYNEYLSWGVTYDTKKESLAPAISGLEEYISFLEDHRERPELAQYFEGNDIDWNTRPVYYDRYALDNEYYSIMLACNTLAGYYLNCGEFDKCLYYKQKEAEYMHMPEIAEDGFGYTQDNGDSITFDKYGRVTHMYETYPSGNIMDESYTYSDGIACASGIDCYYSDSNNRTISTYTYENGRLVSSDSKSSLNGTSSHYDYIYEGDNCTELTSFDGDAPFESEHYQIDRFGKATPLF